MLILKTRVKLNYNNDTVRIFTLEENDQPLASVTLNSNDYLEEFTYKEKEYLLALFDRIFNANPRLVNILIPDVYMKNKVLNKYSNKKSIPHISKYCVRDYKEIDKDKVTYTEYEDIVDCNFEYMRKCVDKYTQGYLQNFHSIVAEYNGEPIGVIIFSMSARFIIGIYVKDEYRRNGIGSELINKALNDEYIWNADIDEYSYYFFDVNGFKIHKTNRDWCVKALGRLPFAMDKMYDKKHVNVANIVLYYQNGILKEEDYNFTLDEIINFSNIEYEYSTMGRVYEHMFKPYMKAHKED